MQVSLSLTTTDLALQLRWYEIRDMLLGQDRVKQDVKRALELATACEHPDAVYLSKIFAGMNVKTKEEARVVFLEQGQNDARALCFAEMLLNIWERDMARVRRSAELGYAFAQALIALLGGPEERFKFARNAALQGERDGYNLLGIFFKHGEECEENSNKAKENFLFAAKLGHVGAMVDYGNLLDESDRQRWLWLGLAAERGEASSFLDSFAKQVETFYSGSGNAAVVFAIGRALKGHIATINAGSLTGRVNLVRTVIFGRRYSSGYLVGPANQAVEFYKAQLVAARKAVDTWTLVCIRYRVVRDIRIMFGKRIWAALELAEYDIINRPNLAAEQPSTRALRAEKRASRNGK